MIRRNLVKDCFMVLKIQVGINWVIYFIKLVIDVFWSQMILMRLSKEYIIDVYFREYGRIEKQKCIFVF